jgi:hypothetical protein
MLRNVSADGRSVSAFEGGTWELRGNRGIGFGACEKTRRVAPLVRRLRFDMATTAPPRTKVPRGAAPDCGGWALSGNGWPTGPALKTILQELAGLSARQAAAELNRRKIPTATGGQWYAATVIRLRERIAL